MAGVNYNESCSHLEGYVHHVRLLLNASMHALLVRYTLLPKIMCTECCTLPFFVKNTAINVLLPLLIAHKNVHAVASGHNE